MAKTARRSKARAARSTKPVPATKSAKPPAETPAPAESEDYVDGCDVEFKSDFTPDEELPQTKGGVETTQETRQTATPQK